MASSLDKSFLKTAPKKHSSIKLHFTIDENEKSWRFGQKKCVIQIILMFQSHTGNSKQRYYGSKPHFTSLYKILLYILKGKQIDPYFTRVSVTEISRCDSSC